MGREEELDSSEVQGPGTSDVLERQRRLQAAFRKLVRNYSLVQGSLQTLEDELVNLAELLGIQILPVPPPVRSEATLEPEPKSPSKSSEG